MRVLIPRLNAAQAAERFGEIEALLRGGASPAQLVRVELDGAVPNATGGKAPTLHDVTRWRAGVAERMHKLPISTQTDQALYSKELGKAIDDLIGPSRSDAGHDGIWSYFTLMLFPDLVVKRWGLSADGNLSVDRWIGAQLGRDRNYLKLSWRNWGVLGEVMDEADPPLGEDEFLSLLERTALARNPRIIKLAAREVIGLDAEHGMGRSFFARELLKRITFQTGPLVLDLLDDSELAALVSEQAEATIAAFAKPRRSMSN